MRDILFILVLFVIFFLISNLPVELKSHEISTLLVGVMLLTSYLFADVLKKIKLPKLTGYMIMGVILGSTGVGFLTSTIMEELQFLENLALCFIALTAGGELRFNILKDLKKSILLILSAQILVIFWGMFFSFILIAGYVPYISQLDSNIKIVLAILFAGIALSKSPATTIGIITEISAHGKITNLVLSVTVLRSIFLIIVFPIALSYTKLLLFEHSQFNLSLLIEISFQLIGSMVMGIIIGILIIWYLKNIRIEISIFLIAVALVITEISSLMGLEILLTSMVTGIVVRNFSKQGGELISSMEIFSLPIYVIFFCFAGASLRIDVLSKAGIITAFLVIIRFFLSYLGNYFGAMLAKEDKVVQNVSWMGYIGQAGIALGVGIIIEKNLPVYISSYFFTVLISTVVINEMIGPILLKYALVKAKEAGVND
jgi:Kef-type K+ transport system membrane component KefB